MKLRDYIKNLNNLLFPPGQDEAEEEISSLKQLEFKNVIIGILVYLLMFLLVQGKLLGSFF